MTKEESSLSGSEAVTEAGASRSSVVSATEHIARNKAQRAYITVTLAYWAFMLTDGALRMLVLLHFHALGFTPIQLAYLFLVYEAMGVVTNLAAGWLGTTRGLRVTLLAGLILQVLALLSLTMLDGDWNVTTSVVFVMLVQGLSGISKDLVKTSAKSALKSIVVDKDGALFHWVAVLTGSKNAVKGLGFLLGALLLSVFGFHAALLVLAGMLALVLAAILFGLRVALGSVRRATPMREVLSSDKAINRLSAARLFLFGSRDAWFVVGVPIFLHDAFHREGASSEAAFFAVGTFMAVWIMAYGAIQAAAPRWLVAARGSLDAAIRDARRWNTGLVFALVPVLGVALWPELSAVATSSLLITGLFLFGFVFAVNSSLHSYLILALTNRERATLDVGFYYMANAGGRFMGTLISGLAYQAGGLATCLGAAVLMAVFARVCVGRLPTTVNTSAEVRLVDSG